MRRHRYLLWASRAIAAASVALAFAIAIPRFDDWARGLSRGTAPEVALAAAWLAACAALLLREALWRQRERLATWAALSADPVGVCDDAYLADVLSLECERARRRGWTFSVFVLRIRPAEGSAAAVDLIGEDAMERFADLLRQLTRSDDRVVLLGARDIVVIALRVGVQDRGGLLERLRVGLGARLTFLLDAGASLTVVGGTATHGADGTDAAELLRVARDAAARETKSEPAAVCLP